MKLKYIITLAAIAASLISCSEKQQNETASSKRNETTEQADLVYDNIPTREQTEQATASFSKYLLKEAPANAVEIATLRKTAKVGDEVTFNGKAIGAFRIFPKARSAMLLGDPNVLTSCDLVPGDMCEKPWDVCCDDEDDIKNTILTIQILDDEGKLIKTSLKGLNGLTELSEVTVTGIVAEGSNENNMIINATGIYVKS